MSLQGSVKHCSLRMLSICPESFVILWQLRKGAIRINVQLDFGRALCETMPHSIRIINYSTLKMQSTVEIPGIHHSIQIQIANNRFDFAFNGSSSKKIFFSEYFHYFPYLFYQSKSTHKGEISNLLKSDPASIGAGTFSAFP